MTTPIGGYGSNCVHHLNYTTVTLKRKCLEGFRDVIKTPKREKEKLMTKFEMEKYYRSRFHDAREEAISTGKIDKIRQNDGVYTPQMIAALRDMAKNGIYPDGSFSDTDCNIWSMFR